jgi:pectin methylesterase-like acyl-CoA thioesterase
MANAHAATDGGSPCPGGASWCDDFEHGARRWQTGAAQGPLTVPQAGTENHLLQVPDQQALLIAAADTGPLTGNAYYVEARLRMASPEAGAGGAVFLLARYADPRNWLGASASASVTADGKRLNIELVAMRDGKHVRLKQVGRDCDCSNSGGFNTLRLEIGSDMLSVYLDGERLTGAPSPFMAGGRAGVLAQGSKFEIDDVRIGPAQHLPGRIALARMGSRLSLQAGDAPRRLPVSAFEGDGLTVLGFTARSSNPAIATVAVDAGALVISAKQPGSATITLTSTADVNVASTVSLTVDAAFAAANQTYALQGRLSPAARAAGVPVDTPLRLTFDGAPTLGRAGSVRIFRAADDRLVDVIRPGEDIDSIGYPGQDYQRVLRYSPIRIDGAQVTIRPHNARLAYDTEYYVAIDPAVLKGAAIKGQPFMGLGREGGWRFRTGRQPSARATLNVAADGPADFRTVQGALNHAMGTVPRAAPVTIRIANGRYEELLYLRGKDRITLRGESRDGVVIAAVNNEKLNPGSGTAQQATSPSVTGGRALLMIEDADLLTLDTLTLANTTTRASSAGGSQAETLYFNSENGRLIATNASFISEQDTIQVKGYSWFYRTLIAGNVDFIWGYNRAALFEQSEIRSLGDSASSDSGGYVVQARTVAAGDSGFVFLDSRLTHAAGPAGNDVPIGATYLARSPGTASTWDNVSYINCRMDRHVAPIGWAGAGILGQPAPHPDAAGAISGWSEYGSMDLAGTPLDMAARRDVHRPAAPRFNSRASVFQGFDGGRGWNPTPAPSK